MTSQLKYVRGTIEAVRREVPRIKILVGGLAFAAAPDIWRTVGADDHARRADAAVAAGARLVVCPDAPMPPLAGS